MKRVMYVLMSLMFLISSCEPEKIIEEVEVVGVTENPELQIYDAPVEELNFGGLIIPVQEVNGLYMHQGDMVMKELPQAPIYDSAEDVPSNKSVSRVNNLWKDGIVYYQINPNLPNKERVIDAMKAWEAVTSITFKNSTEGGSYVYFTTGSGCSSYVGRIGGKQNITLSSGCSTGNTIHEIGHALGLWHEQARVDRETYIEILWDNIASGAVHNFRTYESNGMDGQELSEQLDFGSIMMYGSYAFTSNGRPTMVKRDGATFGSQRSRLSALDIEGINKLYPPSGEPVYENYNFYYVDGVTVARVDDRWWYYTRYGFKEVAQINGSWHYV